MILIKEKKRGEERHTAKSRESNKYKITKVPSWPIYTHSDPMDAAKAFENSFNESCKHIFKSKIDERIINS